MQILTRLNKIIAYSNCEYIPVGNSAVCPTNGTCYNDALIVNVDYVPTDIDQYEYYYIDGKFIKGDIKSIAGRVLWEGTMDGNSDAVSIPEIGRYQVVLLDGTGYMPCMCTVYKGEDGDSYPYVIRGITQSKGVSQGDGRVLVSLSLFSTPSNPTGFMIATSSCAFFTINEGSIVDMGVTDWQVKRIVGIY